AASAVDRSVIETARSLGARRTETVLVTLHEARPALATAVIAGFGRGIAEVGAVMIVGGDIRWSTRVLTTSIVLETRMGDFGMAIALGAILLTLSFAINMALNLIQGERK
ncbi:MAG TPA: ABC transporter permease, partial [Methanocella sp.]|nr:ABC transporter permease [Methanocella sp.]